MEMIKLPLLVGGLIVNYTNISTYSNLLTQNTWMQLYVSTRALAALNANVGSTRELAAPLAASALVVSHVFVRMFLLRIPSTGKHTRASPLMLSACTGKPANENHVVMVINAPVFV